MYAKHIYLSDGEYMVDIQDISNIIFTHIYMQNKSMQILILKTTWLRNGELVLPSQRVTPGTSTLVIRSA